MRSLAATYVASACLLLAEFAHAEPSAASAPQKTPAAAAASANAPIPAGTETAATTPVVVPGDVDTLALEPIPSARDNLGGHFVLGAGLGAKWTLGSLDGNRTVREALGPALAVNADLGFGLSRNVVLGLWGEFDDYSAPESCSSCSGQSYAGGPFLRYHIVQGTRFDPWGALAVGVRGTSVQGDHWSGRYVGIDWLRLTLGGDWYPLANVGIGPYVELDIGAYEQHPHSSAFNSTLHTGIGTGLRLTLDLPGK